LSNPIALEWLRYAAGNEKMLRHVFSVENMLSSTITSLNDRFAMERRADYLDVFDLVVRRCGSSPARFVAVGAGGEDACYVEGRIGEIGAEARVDVVGPSDDDGCEWPHGAAAGFPDECLDFAFIRFDAEAGIGDELAAWWRRLRPGGLLAGNGYAALAGIAAAIDGFVAARGLASVFRQGGDAWMIHKSLRIDAAYCINLAHRLDRRRHAEAQFGKSGIADRVAFFTAIDGRYIAHPPTMSHGQAGCTASHLAVMRTAVESGHHNVLIFEDDVDLVPQFSAQFAAALARCPAGYDLCYLGITCIADWGNFLYPLDDLLSRVGHAFGTHAYVVNLERFAMIERALAGMHDVVDDWYARDLHPCSNCYCCTPYLAYQWGSYSDVSGTHNRNPRADAQYVWR
jgi:hypothetical protein